MLTQSVQALFRQTRNRVLEAIVLLYVPINGCVFDMDWGRTNSPQCVGSQPLLPRQKSARGVSRPKKKKKKSIVTAGYIGKRAEPQQLLLLLQQQQQHTTRLKFNLTRENDTTAIKQACMFSPRETLNC